MINILMDVQVEQKRESVKYKMTKKERGRMINKHFLQGFEKSL